MLKSVSSRTPLRSRLDFSRGSPFYDMVCGGGANLLRLFGFGAGLDRLEAPQALGQPDTVSHTQKRPPWLAFFGFGAGRQLTLWSPLEPNTLRRARQASRGSPVNSAMRACEVILRRARRLCFVASSRAECRVYERDVIHVARRCRNALEHVSPDGEEGARLEVVDQRDCRRCTCATSPGASRGASCKGMGSRLPSPRPAKRRRFAAGVCAAARRPRPHLHARARGSRRAPAGVAARNQGSARHPGRRRGLKYRIVIRRRPCRASSSCAPTRTSLASGSRPCRASRRSR